jgi:tetratricopeptide (TPR) repeat protein
MTQEEVATWANCSTAMISDYENSVCPITDEILANLKQVMCVEDIPFTEEEIAACRRDLYTENDVLNLNDDRHVGGFIAGLERLAELSFDVGLQILSDLHRASVMYALGKMDDYDKLMDSLNGQKNEFTDEHFYWYYRYQGYIEYMHCHYKAAMLLYLQAKEIGDRIHLTDATLKYNIGNSYAMMGYPYLSNKYLEVVQRTKSEEASLRHWYNIQRLVAVNCSKLEGHEKPIKNLESCLRDLMEDKANDRFSIGGVYFDMGLVYLSAGDFEKSLENFDRALKQYDWDGGAYLSCLCHKTLLLRMHDRNDEAHECMEKAYEWAEKDTFFYDWLDAIKHSMTLHIESSIMYLESTSIPKFMDYGKYEFVINCYEWISSHHKKQMKHKRALEYSNKAMELYKHLMKGEFPV